MDPKQWNLTMWENEQFAGLIAKEPIQNAVRRAEQARVLRCARAPSRPMRVRLGSVLAKLGCWMMGQHCTDPGHPPEYGPVHFWPG